MEKGIWGLTATKVGVEFSLLTKPHCGNVGKLFNKQIKQWCGRTSQFVRVDRIARTLR